MTEIERRALALVNEVRAEWDLHSYDELNRESSLFIEALCRALEQYEAYKQEVSDACGTALETMVKAGASACERSVVAHDTIARFIIAKPVDPLVDILADAFWDIFAIPQKAAEAACEAIEKRGGKIVWGEGA